MRRAAKPIHQLRQQNDILSLSARKKLKNIHAARKRVRAWQIDKIPAFSRRQIHFFALSHTKKRKKKKGQTAGKQTHMQTNAAPASL